MSNFNLGVFLVFLSAAGFATIPFLAIHAYQGGASVPTLLVVRFILAAMFFFAYVVLSGNKVPVKGRIKHLFLMGGILYTAMSTLYFSSVKFIPASLAVLLLYLYPIFVAVGSSLIDKECIRMKVFISICMSLFGLTMVLGTSFEGVNKYGVILAAGSAVVYSCYILLGNRVVKEIPAMVTSAYVSVFAAISLLVIGLTTGSLNFNLTQGAWLAVAGVALFGTILPMFTFFRGLELIGSTRASILSMIEPLITIGLAALLLGERLTHVQFVGAIIVLAGAVMVMTAPKNKEVPMAAGNSQAT